MALVAVATKRERQQLRKSRARRKSRTLVVVKVLPKVRKPRKEMLVRKVARRSRSLAMTMTMKKPKRLQRKSKPNKKIKTTPTRKETKNLSCNTLKRRKLNARLINASSRWFANAVKWLQRRGKRRLRTHSKRKRNKTRC